MSNKTVVLWGAGLRGKAFIKFFSKIQLFGLYITDKDKQKLLGCGIDEEWYLDTNYVWDVATCIVASNDKIFQLIEGKCQEKEIPCINLERYCPWD